MLARFSRVNLNRRDELQAYADVLAAGSREDWGELAQARQAEEFATEALSTTDIVEFYLVHIAGEDEAPIGGIEIAASDTRDPETASVYIRILKSVQGYGFGLEALRFAEERARQLGRTKLMGSSSARSKRDTRNVRFLLKSGFQERLMLLRQDLELGGPCDVLRRLASPPDGVEVVPHWGAQSTRDMTDIVTLLPSFGSDIGREPSTHIPDVESLVTGQQHAADAGRNLLFTLARSTETGQLLGFTELRFGSHDAIAEQYTTFVHPEHRRRGIGAAIKARALLAVTERAPELPRIRTFIPAEDAALANLNRKLGYADTAFYREWERAL